MTDTTTNKNDFNGSSNEKRSKKKLKKGNENVALLNPNSACSLEEKVFSIDHILESICADLDRKTLLKCRLLSLRWVYYSSIALQKIITLKFEHSYKDGKSALNQVLLYRSRKDRPIKDLVTLMNTSTNFPCSSFSFGNDCDEKMDSLAQRFFNAHGTFIKKLRFEEYLLLSELKRLLLSQVPNLEQLVLNYVEITLTESESRLKKSDSEERRRRKESLFNETTTICPGPSSGLNKPVLKNLKVFICDAIFIPEIFILQVLECSPNLVEVFLKLEFIHLLLQPVNRLHLLKKMEVEIEEKTIESLKALASNDQPKNWAVREIQFLSYAIYREPVLALEAGEAFTKILNACSQICQTLEWSDHIENFVIPPTPCVKHFSFEYYENRETGLPANLFPEGVSLEDTFPNLKSLEISSVYEMKNLPIENILGDTLPLPGVKKVSLKLHAGPNLLPSFREMFPNAKITEFGPRPPRSESDEDDSNSD